MKKAILIGSLSGVSVLIFLIVLTSTSEKASLNPNSFTQLNLEHDSQNSAGGGIINIKELASQSNPDFARINLETNFNDKFWSIQAKPTNDEINPGIFHITYSGQGDVLTLKGDGSGAIIAGNLELFGQLNQPSDRRLKTDIHPLGLNVLDKIMKTNPVQFRWEKNPSDIQTGFIAQDLEAIYPELIGASANGNLHVNYLGLIPYLFAGMQQQQLMIQRQDEEIKLLKQLLARPE